MDSEMTKNLFIAVLGWGGLFALCYWAHHKRRQNTRRCPRCGTECHASGWSTGLRDGRTGAYIYSFKCPKCGHKFKQ